ncbi:DDE-type integrase/transposase/recombinase [bacterium AH-315-E09]|nr:DDE-type integrase/transposase/recombinase [bacterium AH-315-G05]MBN4074556.1 DDE-type integrase/transposase/recombinase [bacterium AH-315-E09]
MPIIETPRKLDFKVLLTSYHQSKGKSLKPVNTRKSSTSVSSYATCPRCGAPSTYIYDNSGGRGQLLCKVCGKSFNLKNDAAKNIFLRCPHCSKRLEKVKERFAYFIYKCKNNDCPLYVKNLNSMSKESKLLFSKSPGEFRVRYLYRQYRLTLAGLSKISKSVLGSRVDLSKIHFSKHILGLVLTYHINYGLSTRQTSSILKDVHGVSISHQTVSNYAMATAKIVRPFSDDFPYPLTDSLCADETYVKVRGKKSYVFFFFDSVKKIIIAHDVFFKRDTISAIKSIFTALSKFKKIPESLSIVVDGNPIYVAAQHFFLQNNISFKIHQVIGLMNKDEVSKEYRPLKQVIERLNRTLKRSYRPKNCFKTLAAANSFLTLFAVFFNFLRPHSSLEKRVPVEIPELKKLPHMPARWLKIIEMSYDHIASLQSQAS